MTSGQLAIQVDRPTGGPTMTLRPYQTDAVAAVLAGRDRGIRRGLVVMPTGTGKTVVFAGLAAKLGVRTLVLAHRDELINQAVGKFHAFWPAADVGVVKAERDESAAQVVVASVQTLARQQRLYRFPRDFGLVVVDEAHHSTSASYTRVLKYLGCFQPDGPLLVGVTATPDRGDRQGLHSVFQEIVCSYDILWAIRHGYLADIRARQVLLDLNLEDVEVTRGDYNEGELGRVMDAANAPQHVATAWAQHGEGRKTIVFTPTVSLARDTALAFQTLGVPTGFVSGTTPLDERRQFLADFHTGRIRVAVNCGVLTEGYDEPSVEAIILARPTKSRLLYAQMLGRALRKHPGKQDALILDVVGATDDHSLITLPTLFGLPPRALRKLTVAEAAALNEAGRLGSDGDERTGPGLDEQPPEGRLVAKDVDLFPTRLAWTPATGGRFVLPVRGAAVVLQPNQDGTWAVLEVRDRRPQPLQEGVTLELAQGVGEDRVRELGAGLAHRLAHWRKQPANDRQRGKIRRLGLPVTDRLTAGEASDLILAADIAEVLR